MALAVTVLAAALLVGVQAAVSVAALALAQREDEGAPVRKRLTHRETAAVEDAIALAAALAVQVGTVLHILRRGPDAYPADLPAGALWRAAVEALERAGHLQPPQANAGANGHQDTT